MSNITIGVRTMEDKNNQATEITPEAMENIPSFGLSEESTEPPAVLEAASTVTSFLADLEKADKHDSEHAEDAKEIK